MRITDIQIFLTIYRYKFLFNNSIYNMKPILMVGATTVTFALIAYSIAIITEQRKKIITPKILLFLTIGIILDITATICMIAGTSNSAFTFHGLLGYSALLLMLIDTYLIWKFKIDKGFNQTVPHGIHIYSRLAYMWWVIAYVTGAVLVAV